MNVQKGLKSRIDDSIQQQLHPTTPKSSAKPQKRKRPLDDLMEEQVSLFGNQLTCMEGILEQLKERNVIEKEKLELKKRKYSVLYEDD